MKIKKLIRAFELAIPTYQKAVDEKWDYEKISLNNMECGLCKHIRLSLKYEYIICDTISTYYNNYLHGDLLFPNYVRTYSIKKSILPRLEFMKSEVKDLKRLLKKGYTHV